MKAKGYPVAFEASADDLESRAFTCYPEFKQAMDRFDVKSLTSMMQYSLESGFRAY